MLVSEAKTALKRYGFDDNDPLITWLNAALHQFETEADWDFLDSYTQGVAYTVAVQTFAPPTGRIINVYDHTNQLKLARKSWAFFMRELDPTATGQPRFWTISPKDGVGYLWPIPNASGSLDFLTQTVYADLGADGTALYPPTSCHWAIVQLAAAYALQAENEEDRAANAMQQYQASLLTALGRYTEATLDEPDEVQDVMDYGGQSWR